LSWSKGMPETIEDRRERGLAVVEGLLGAEFARQLRATATSAEFGASIARMAIDNCFADSWGQEGLGNRDRSLVMLGTLIGLQQPKELKNHIKIAILNGLTVREIEAVLVQASPYVGAPAISSALTAAVEALREAGLSPDTLTAEEKGLL